MNDNLSLFEEADYSQPVSTAVLEKEFSDDTEITSVPEKIINQRYVIQPNTITKAMYDMNLGSKRIIAMACSLLLERDAQGILTAKKDLTVNFKLEDVMRTLNLSHGSTTKKMLEQGIETIFDQKLRLKTDNGWTKLTHWFVSTEYSTEKNGINLTFTPEVAHAFIEYLNGYSVINLDVYGNLTGKYSIRMYELCWSYHGYASKTTGEWKTPVIPLSEIRQMWQIDDSKYTVMSDFKKRVLDVARNEINKYKNTQFTVTEIEPVRSGRTISGFIFHCRLSETDKEKISASPAALKANVPSMTEEEKREKILHEHAQEVVEKFKELQKYITATEESEKFHKENEAFEQAKILIYQKYR